MNSAKAKELAKKAEYAIRDGKHNEAIALYKESLKLNPHNYSAHVNTGLLYTKVNNSAKATEHFREAITLQPNEPASWVNLSGALSVSGQKQAAVRAIEEGIIRRPNFGTLRSNLCVVTLYSDSDGSKHLEALKGWREVSAKHFRDDDLEVYDVGDTVKIGFLSADMRQHSVAYFLFPVVKEMTKHKNIQVVLYHDIPVVDRVTKMFQGLDCEFVPVRKLNNNSLTEKIRKDCVHILFDLGGHFANNRQLVFAKRAAPCQISWLAYPGSPGTKNLDCTVADHTIYPDQDRGPFGEKLLRLETGHHCFSPTMDYPEPTKRPDNQPTTFGCFNSSPKLTMETVELWGDILAKLPEAMLMLKSRIYEDESVKQRILGWISSDTDIQARVLMLGRDANIQDHIKRHNSVDVILDTFPYNGTTAVCEALWMGTPVITLQGHVHQSRVASSLLTQAGLTDMIATTKEEYVQKAVELGGNREEVNAYKMFLRDHLKESNLTNASELTKELMAKSTQALKEMMGVVEETT